MARSVVQHPSTQRLVFTTAQRWDALKAEYQRACDLMWTGALGSFSAEEMRIIESLGFLSDRDRQLLRRIGRPAPPPSTKGKDTDR